MNISESKNIIAIVKIDDIVSLSPNIVLKIKDIIATIELMIVIVNKNALSIVISK